MKLLNAFSVNMLSDFPARVTFDEVDEQTARAVARSEDEPLQSSVGHPETATLFTSILGTAVPCVRSTVTLARGEVAMLGQYTGPRLPEGATTLPEGAKIRWFRVLVS